MYNVTESMLPCPFCGGNMLEPIAKQWTNCLGDVSYSAWIICKSCNLTLETNSLAYETVEAAENAVIAAWNNRATMGSETCKYDETEIIPVIRIFANDALGDRIHVLECTECGGTYEHVNGDYEYCPRCGRRCEGERVFDVHRD